MNRYIRRLREIICFCVVVGLVSAAAADEPSDELLTMISNLVSDKDKDVRALGLQQVREEAKGTAATKRFAALLPKLPPDAQAGLLDALADRGDIVARPAVLDMLKSSDEPVRTAAIRALGPLGEAADAALLVTRLAAGADAEKTAARGSITRLRGRTVNEAIAAEVKRTNSPIRVELIGILTTRRAVETLPTLLAVAADADAAVRAAAVDALGELAGPEQAAAMVNIVLKAEKGPQRDAAERAVMLACHRIEDPNKRAEPLLAAMAKLGDAERTALLPTLGRVGGQPALKVVEAAMADRDPERREAGFRALFNWPDASIAPRLLELAQTDGDASRRLQSLRALIRVAPLPDKRPAAEKLDLLKKAMVLATHDEDRNTILKRARAIRTIESLRFVLGYLDQPIFAQQAAETVVELAHHRELREPNKAEFDRALDAAIRTSKDPGVVERANRYKRGQT